MTGQKLKLKTPTVVSLIMTDVCNLQCRHCQNYWRKENRTTHTMSKQEIGKVLERFIEAGIFHVAISGGEPLIYLDSLEYLVKRLLRANISISLNSNLTLATPERMKHLYDIGVEHIITSLNSHKAETNDHMNCQQGAWKKIVHGIKMTVDAGIRVSSNMIIQRINMDHTYEVGRLLSSLGVKKMFSTRSVMPSFAEPDEKSNYFLTPDESKRVLNEMIRVKKDFGIAIGTLVSYPLCFLGDLEKYRDFVGRGCPSQSSFAIGVYANGDACTCCHSDITYGNIFAKSIAEIFQNMRPWHSEQHYKGCLGCEYIDTCETGCRMIAHVAEGSYAGRDPLMVGPAGVTVPYKSVVDKTVIEKIKNGSHFSVPKRLRFRKEDGFYLINVRWGNTTYTSIKVAKFLKCRNENGTLFTITEFPGTLNEMIALYERDVIESEDSGLKKDIKFVGHNLVIPKVST